MAFTYRIIDIYRELALERIAEIGVTTGGAQSALRCFVEFERLLKNQMPNASTRRALKKLIKNTIIPARNGMGDPALRAFLGYAIEYVQSRLIDVPRYLYVPWNAADATELMQWGQAWKTFAEGRGKTLEIYAKDTGRDAFKDIHPLSQIYIFGHGAPGDATLAKSAKQLDATGLNNMQRAALLAAETAPLNFSLVASALVTTKLSTTFAGCLKVYACSGGREGSQAVNKVLARPMGSTSFVRLFANHMRSRGYKECEIVGYEEDLAAPTMWEEVGARTVAVTDQQRQEVFHWAKIEAYSALLSVASPTDEDVAREYKKAISSQLRTLNLKRASSVAKRL